MTSYVKLAKKTKRKLERYGGNWSLNSRGLNTGTEDRPIYASPTVDVICGVRSTSVIRSPEGLVTGYVDTLLVPHDASIAIGDVLTKDGVEFKVGDIDFIQPGDVVIMQTLTMAA